MFHNVSQEKVAKWLGRFHLVMTIFWVIMFVPTVLWWKNSILYLGLVSVYALAQGHFTSVMAIRSEKRAMENGNK